ncbi:MAG: DUF871 domain-containing protein [Erysipelotrichaceae bacterium]|nr:DUF871 domain-containing protein [Erysipelotrichaceae bacterium]
MVRLGVSVYPDLSSLEEIDSYLKLASSYGFTRVFSSMFSVEDTPENIVSYFKKFIEIAHHYKMEVSLDVNPMFLETLGVTPEDISLFHEIGCDIIRLDMCYGGDRDIQMINNPYGIVIEFNASGTPIQGYIDAGVSPDKFIVCHNFYPQRYTALKWKDFNDINKEVSKYGVKIGAFISSHAPNTHGVWDAKCGLPTVEIHRDLPINLQLRHMLATKMVDDILIGNAYASEEEFKAIQEVVNKPLPEIKNDPIMQMITKGNPSFGKSQVILKANIEKDISDIEREILFEYAPHFETGDASEWMIRSRFSRMKYSKIGVPYRPVKQSHFHRGDILIVNNNYQHYAGEVQICLMDMVNDGERNLVGHLDQDELRMLELIGKGDIFSFIEK